MPTTHEMREIKPTEGKARVIIRNKILYRRGKNPRLVNTCGKDATTVIWSCTESEGYRERY
jgi:hypothetical protein